MDEWLNRGRFYRSKAIATVTLCGLYKLIGQRSIGNISPLDSTGADFCLLYIDFPVAARLREYSEVEVAFSLEQSHIAICI
jgi:hypothetical protein